MLMTTKFSITLKHLWLQSIGERINSGLDYRNGGMVDWRVFVLVFIICHVVSSLQFWQIFVTPFVYLDS